MTRRLRFTVLVAAATVAVSAGMSAGTADASPIRYVYHGEGSIAMASWEVTRTTSDTGVFLYVYKGVRGRVLDIFEVTSYHDANGFAGYAQTSYDVPVGFTFSISGGLTSGVLEGHAVPGTTCRYDANFNEVGCGAVTTDVNVTWAGKGRFRREVEGDHLHESGYTEADHTTGVIRSATATGTLGRLRLRAGAFLDGLLSRRAGGSTIICFGSPDDCDLEN